MPLYLYFCSSCNIEEEFLMKMGENIRPPCPSCEYFMEKIDCPGGGFRIEGVGIADPKSIRT